MEKKNQYGGHIRTERTGVGYQEIILFRSPPNTFANISITEVTMTGTKSETCFFGGISFLNNLVEILQLCFNTSRETSNKVSFPFISTSNETLMTVYAEGNTELDVWFEFGFSRCKGVFVNPCMNHCINRGCTNSHPFIKSGSLKGKFFPNTFQKRLLMYGFPFKTPQGDCLAIQVAPMYFEMKSDGCSGPILIQTCRGKDKWVKKCNGKWNGANVQLSHHFWPQRDFGGQSALLHDSSSLGISNKVAQTHGNVSVAQKLTTYMISTGKTSEWFKRFTFYSTPGSDGIGGVKSFSLNIQLSQTQGQSHDALFYQFGPHSKSVIVLAMKFTSGELSHDLLSFSSPLGSAPNNAVCLKTAVKGILRNNFIMDMTCNPEDPKVVTEIGRLTMTTNLCISEGYFKNAFGRKHKKHKSYFTEKNIFRICPFEKHNWGEDHLMWNAELHAKYFLTAQSLRVFLPGKIFNAELFSKKGISKISLGITWLLKPEQMAEENTNHKRVLFDVLSQNTKGDYEQPIARSWFEGRHLCQKHLSVLPGMSSHADVTAIVTFVEHISFTALVTHFFIGFTGQQVVCTLNKVIHFSPVPPFLVSWPNELGETLCFQGRHWKWDDRRPVGVQMWGYPFSLPKLAGNSCLVLNIKGQNRGFLQMEHREYHPSNISFCLFMSSTNPGFLFLCS